MTAGHRRFNRARGNPPSLQRAMGPVSVPAHGQGLHAAATWVDLTPCLGLRMGGFGLFKGHPTKRICGRLGASIVLLDDGQGHRALLIACDLHAGLRVLSERIALEVGHHLGVTSRETWLMASHCHTGPGNIYAELLYDSLATRKRGYDEATVRFLVQQIVDGARPLAGRLEPAQLGVAAVDMDALGGAPHSLVWNRSILATLANRGERGNVNLRTLADQPLSQVDVDFARDFRTDLSGRAPSSVRVPNFRDITDISEKLGRLANDSRLQMLHVSSRDGTRDLCSIGFVHATPTVLGPRVRCLSGDVTAAACRRVWQKRGQADYPVSLVGGAIADANVVHPSLSIAQFRKERLSRSPAGIVEMMGQTADHLADALIAAQAQARASARSDLPIDARLGTFQLPGEPVSRGGRMPKHIKVGNNSMAGSELLRAELKDSRATFEEPSYDRFRRKRKRVVRKVGSGAHSPKRSGWTSLSSTLGWARRAVRVMTPEADLRVLRLGPTTLVALPVEPSLGLARLLKQRLFASVPADQLVLAGLSGGYLGYATTEWEYRVQDYEGASTYWGRDFGDRLLDAVGQLMHGTPPPGASKEVHFATRKTHVDEDGQPTPMVRLDPRVDSDRVNPSNLPRLSVDARSVQGWWYGPLPNEAERATPVAGSPIIVRLLVDGQPWAVAGSAGRIEVNDRNFDFLLRRRFARQRERIVWSFWVARSALPALPPADRLSFEVLGRGPFREVP